TAGCRPLVFTFFFSSRRRHTRFSRDWSSDVCSSDLRVIDGDPRDPAENLALSPDGRRAVFTQDGALKLRTVATGETTTLVDDGRSEERRVGKECRSRGCPGH